MSDSINLCNPDARILKHMNISINKLKREAGRFLGMYLPNGFQIENHFDLINFTEAQKTEYINFGMSRCINKENVTGCCKGHQPDDISAPADFKISAPTADEFKSIKSTHFGKLFITKELEEAHCGDYITLENPETAEKIKVVITTKRIFGFSGKFNANISCYIGVALVMQREKPNGKIQYFI